jgi:hypothetical protein
MAASLIPRSLAKQRGLKRYFTGEPCVRGHIAERVTANGTCHHCFLDRRRSARSARPGYRTRTAIIAETKAATRECGACHVIYPATAEFFAPLRIKQKNGTIWAGFARECRPCRNKRFAPFYEKNREQQIERALTYNRQHRAAKRHRDMLRYTRQLEATPAWIDLERIRLIYEDADYLTRISGEKYEVDHMHPLQHSKLCGLHVPWNLQVITKRANSSKGNRWY